MLEPEYSEDAGRESLGDRQRVAKHQRCQGVHSGDQSVGQDLPYVSLLRRFQLR